MKYPIEILERHLKDWREINGICPDPSISEKIQDLECAIHNLSINQILPEDLIPIHKDDIEGRIKELEDNISILKNMKGEAEQAT